MNDAVPAETPGRAYRSKKHRPCDLCRSRKIQCKIQTNQTTCELCSRLDRRCTYLVGPLRRKPRAGGGADRRVVASSQRQRRRQHQQQPQVGVDRYVDQDVADTIHVDVWAGPDTENFTLDEYPFEVHHKDPNAEDDYGQFRKPSLGGLYDSSAESGSSGTSDRCTTDHTSPQMTARDVGQAEVSEAFALDAGNSMALGLSGEADPFLLRYYQYDDGDMHVSSQTRVRKVVDDLDVPACNNEDQLPRGIPLQFSMVDDEEPVLHGADSSNEACERLGELVTPELESRLLMLYTASVHHQYPVLSLSDLQSHIDSNCSLASVGIRSAVYALAAQFASADIIAETNAGQPVPIDSLWSIAQSSFQRASRFSHLSVLQLCLLLLQAPPRNSSADDSPSLWSLSCSSLAIAENLGLNVDPSNWRLPRREITLRRRLWWYTYMGHTWQALVRGRPSHINDSSWDVLDLSEDDFERGEDVDDAVSRQVSLCVASSKLCLIAADVLKELYTLRANREAVSLSMLLFRAQPLRARIQGWRQTHPLLRKPVADLTEDEFAECIPLRLSHLTLEILIFRALLRPLHPAAMSSLDASQEPISTIFENCYKCAKVTAEVVASLDARHFDCFWFPDVRHQLCYVSSFMLLNIAQSATGEMATRNKELLEKWRDTLAKHSQKWAPARLAAGKLESQLSRGLDCLVAGPISSSPVGMLMKEEV